MTNLGVSDVAGRRIREVRQHLGWTVRDLAERCAQAGVPQITSTVITNLETRRRKSREITVDEWLALARVLEVPPLQLLLPLDPGEEVEILPGTEMDALEAIQWIGGPAVPLNAREIHSTLSDGTVRLLRTTDPGDLLTLLRQADYLLGVVVREDRVLTASPGSSARLMPLLADRLMHVAARLEALGYLVPVARVREILDRRGLPSTLVQWRERGAEDSPDPEELPDDLRP
jgi:transcriptional regulator with XRE-family HTH domain